MNEKKVAWVGKFFFVSAIVLFAFSLVLVAFLFPVYMRSQESVKILMLGDESVEFNVADVNSFYLEEYPNEFSACLFGKKDGNIWKISEIRKQDVDTTPFTSDGQCITEPFAIGHMHSHPDAYCYPSHADYMFFSYSYAVRGQTLFAIACGNENGIRAVRFYEVRGYSEGSDEKRPSYVCFGVEEVG